MFNFFQRKKTEPAVLPMRVDIHCHVVPGVDDGAPTVDVALELVKRMKGMGLTKIIASPHVTQDTFENTAETLDPALASLRDAVAAAGLDIEIDRSAEYRIDDFFMQQLKEGNIKLLPDRHILVENSFIQEPWNLEKTLFDLKVKGYKPILAHPERYLYYHQGKMARYKQLHDIGTLFQVNMLSIAGAYGKPEKEIALKLLDNGYVDFIGTDLHNMRHIEILEQYLASREYSKIRAKLEASAKNDERFGG